MFLSVAAAYLGHLGGGVKYQESSVQVLSEHWTLVIIGSGPHYLHGTLELTPVDAMGHCNGVCCPLETWHLK